MSLTENVGQDFMTSLHPGCQDERDYATLDLNVYEDCVLRLVSVSDLQSHIAVSHEK